MKLHLSPEEMRPLVSEIVQSTIERFEADRAKLGSKMAYSETEAARLLSLNPHQLRDERQRGRISHSRIVGNGIRYSQQDLLAYLGRNRSEASEKSE